MTHAGNAFAADWLQKNHARKNPRSAEASAAKGGSRNTDYGVREGVGSPQWGSGAMPQNNFKNWLLTMAEMQF